MSKENSEHWILDTGNCFGTSSSILKLANEFLLTHSLSDLLPYRSFDPETQLFLNRTSVGFVLETLPLVGCGEEIPRQLTGVFQHALPLGSNLQCLLIASPHIDTWLKKWGKARCDLILNERADILRELAKERCLAFKNHSGMRTFRLLISYSEPHKIFKSFEDILALREQLITTLKGWNLPIRIWHATDLLLGLDELLNPTELLLGNHESLWNPHESLWNPHESLSPQLMSPATRLQIDPSHLIFGEEEKVLRLYTTRLLPPLWHLSAMGHLIGDPFEEFLRLQGSFFLSYGVHIAHEKILKTKMLAKCGNVEKQAASPIAKYVPSLRKEAQEWTFVREKFEEGQRLVRTRFQVGLLSPPDQIAREEQTLFNLYRSQRWELVLDKYLQLPAFLIPSCNL